MKQIDPEEALKLKFKQALQRGSSEAHLLLRLNPHIDFTELLLHELEFFSVKEYKKDEYSAAYYYELVNLCPNPTLFLIAVIQHFENAKEYKQGDSLLLGRLAAYFVLDGHKVCRTALYRHARLNRSEDTDIEAFMMLDGLDGGLWLINNLGVYIKNSKDAKPNPHLLTLVQERYPEMKTAEALEKALQRYPYLHKYIAYAQTAQVASNNTENPQVNDATAPEEGLSEAEITDLAYQLVTTRPNRNTLAILKVFNKVPYPLDCSIIIRHARGKIEGPDSSAAYAFGALGCLRHPLVRNFILRKMNKSPQSHYCVDGLAANYEPGDMPYWLELINNKHNFPHHIHFGDCLLRAYKEHRNDEIRDILSLLISKLDQPSKRYHIYKQLAELGGLNKRLLAEMRYDAYLDTRNLYNSEINKPKLVTQD